MGLTIRVYNNVSLVPEGAEDYDFWCYVVVEKWRWKVKNLNYNRCYNGDVDYNGISYSYSYHAFFRGCLLNLIGMSEYVNKIGQPNWSKLESKKKYPFEELIDFADNEGCLDWEVSKKLYNDFLSFNDKAKDSEFYHHYETWMQTFKVAKDNGVVVFS